MRNEGIGILGAGSLGRAPRITGALVAAALAFSALPAATWAQKAPAKPAAPSGASTPAAAPSGTAKGGAPSDTAKPGAAPSGTAKPGAAAGASKPGAPADASKPGAPTDAANKPATPQPAPDPADEHYKAGVAFYKLKKFAEAETSFEAAFELKKTYDIAVNLGDVESRLEKFAEAATHLSFALRNWPPSGKTEAREAAARALDEARKRAAALHVVLGRSGAQILVDGKVVGTTPLDDNVFVEPGARVVEVKLAGLECPPMKINAKAGAVTDVTVEFTPVKPKPEPAVVVDRGASRRRTIILFAGGGVATLGLALGIGFAAAANGKANAANTLRASLGPQTACSPQGGGDGASCTELSNTVKSQQTLSNAALGSFLAGGLVAAGTAGFVIWQLLSPPKPRDAKPAVAHVVPVLSPTQSGVAVVGAW